MAYYRPQTSHKFRLYSHMKGHPNISKKLKVGDRIYNSISHAARVLDSSHSVLTRYAKEGLLFKGMKVEFVD